MNNWNELDSYARSKVELRRQEAEEWRLARLTQGNTQETAKGAGSSFALSRMLIDLFTRLRAAWLGA